MPTAHELANEWVVMVDGQEVARGPIIANNPNPEITFTSNRKHFYFLGTTDHGMSGFYFDGKLIVQDGSPTPVISPDGDHYAYTVHATKGAGELLKFIIDGKPAGYLGDHPQWSADSKHLFTTAPGTTDILLDGKPFLRAQRATLTIPPVGSMVVATLIRSGTGPQVSFLVIGGKKIDGSEAEAIIHVTISPDGKHYAALCSGNGKFWVFSDGKRGLSYDNITPDDAVKFTADSSKVVYTPTANGKHFLVMGDQESEGFDYPPKVVIAPAGSHAGVLYDGGPSSSVIIDAKTFSAGVGLNAATDLGFSPDGSHFAYVAGQRLILDGVPQPASIILPISVPHTYLPFVFSRDNKHIAHGAANPVQTGRPDQGVFLDGKFLSMAPLIAGRGLYQMTFTPDSKHLLWLMDGKPNGQLSAVRLYLDGQFLAEEYYRGGNWFNTGGWDMQLDGSLLMLVQDNASLKRIRITPSPGASIETFLATGFAPRR